MSKRERMTDLLGNDALPLDCLDTCATPDMCVVHGCERLKIGERDSRAIPECTCSQCGKLLDGISDAIGHHRGPRPGDFTICLGCGHVLAIGEGMVLRELTDDELLLIAGNKDMLALQKARGYVMKGKG